MATKVVDPDGGGMSARMEMGLWIAFWLVGLISWFVYFMPWISFVPRVGPWYFPTLFLLGAISVGLAAALLALGKRTRRSIALAVLGVAGGQCWLLLWLAVFAIWRLRGFAP